MSPKIISLLLASAVTLAVVGAPSRGLSAGRTATTEKGKVGKVVKTDVEWKKKLGSEQYRVLRTKGTEMAFTGKLWDHHASGTYRCAGCGLELFSSDTKFDSGTGWPSFWAPIGKQNVGEHRDVTLGMTRVEVLCNRCDGHLGHVFDDGPKPTGLRYCINSAALTFEKKK